jgi:putative oxidoreductase
MDQNNLSKYHDVAHLLLRIGVGIVFLIAGWGKMNGLYTHLFTDESWGFVEFVSGLGFPFPLLFAAIVALSEFIGAIMILSGFKQKYVLPFLMIIMLVAIFMVKWSEGFSEYRIDFVLLLNLIAMYILGSGKYSVDAMMNKGS